MTTALSKDVKTIKISKQHSRKQHQRKVMCTQKDIPVIITESLEGHMLTASFTAQRKIESLSLENVRGVDGVSVLRFKDLINQKLNNGESIESTVELGNFEGLAYVVFDLSITVKKIKTNYSIPISVGALSKKQITERGKNIRELKNKSQQKNGANFLTAPAKKIHEMKLE